MSFSKMLEILKEKNKGKLVIIKLGAFYVATEEDAVLLQENVKIFKIQYRRNLVFL